MKKYSRLSESDFKKKVYFYMNKLQTKPVNRKIYNELRGVISTIEVEHNKEYDKELHFLSLYLQQILFLIKQELNTRTRIKLDPKTMKDIIKQVNDINKSTGKPIFIKV